MGVQTIIGLIEREAADEAAGIVAAAEETAAQAVAEAEAGVAARVAEALERHGTEIRAGSQRRINVIRLRVLEERATMDAELLGLVFGTAGERLEAIADPEGSTSGPDRTRWAAALARLGADALDSVGQGARLRVRRCDAGALAELASEQGAVLEPADDDISPGVVATSVDGRIEVDASLPVRLERARTLLAESVAATLALRPGDVGPVLDGTRAEGGG